jgi:hypothetical protein
VDEPQEIVENAGPKPGPREVAEKPVPKATPPVSRAGAWVRKGRAPLIFALAGVLIALVAGGAYIYKQAVTPPPRTPEETITEFLTAVFLAKDATRVSAVVCASWDPVDALERTAKEVDARATVSWDEIRLLSATEDRVSARARLGLRLRDDNQPAFYRQWRFSLVQENGWRVCEARPFVV